MGETSVTIMHPQIHYSITEQWDRDGLRSVTITGTYPIDTKGEDR